MGVQTRKAAGRTAKTVRLDEAGVRALSTLVQRAGVGASENDVIQRAIIDAAEHYSLESDVLAAFEDGQRRWSEVLDRLA